MHVKGHCSIRKIPIPLISIANRETRITTSGLRIIVMLHSTSCETGIFVRSGLRRAIVHFMVTWFLATSAYFSTNPMKVYGETIVLRGYFLKYRPLAR